MILSGVPTLARFLTRQDDGQLRNRSYLLHLRPITDENEELVLQLQEQIMESMGVGVTKAETGTNTPEFMKRLTYSCSGALGTMIKRMQAAATEAVLEAKMSDLQSDLPLADAKITVTLEHYATVAYRLCAVVGQMKLFGASENSDWTSSRMHEACCSGFDILSDETALSNFLNEQHDRHFTRKKSSSRYRIYGPFQRFLTYLCDEPGARSLIDFVRKHAMDALPIGPYDDFIGGGGVRKWHTIRTAKLEFNMDTRLVRKMLVERGVLSESQAKLRDNDILIPAREIESLAGARDDGVYLGYVKEKFGIVEATAKQLMNLGVIEPLFGAVNGMKTKFSQTAIDATLAAAISGLPERDDDGELVPLVDATHLGARSVANLFAAVVAGRLKARAVSTQSSRVGIMRLLFDPVEVRKEFIKKVGVKRHEFTAIFKFRPLEGDQFFYSDFFERTRERSPTNHREFDVITRTSLEQFQREHLSLAAIAKGRGRPVDMKRLLDQAIILPVWQIEGRRALTFYRRSDIKEFLESLG